MRMTVRRGIFDMASQHAEALVRMITTGDVVGAANEFRGVLDHEIDECDRELWVETVGKQLTRRLGGGPLFLLWRQVPRGKA